MAFKVNLFLLDLVAIILVVCLQIECVLPQHLSNVMNGNLGRSKILRVGSQLQRSIALHSNASWHTVELTPFEEIGKNLGIKRRRDASDLRDVISAMKS